MSKALVPTTLRTIEAMAMSDDVPQHLTESIEAGDWKGMSVPQRVDVLEFFKEEMAITTEGLQPSFPVVKYPTSGASFWEVPTATGEPEALRELKGVVVFKQMVRVYYPIDAAISNLPPTCSSLDTITPVDGSGKQAAACASCPQAQWGTGKEGRGQACKQRLRVFLLREGQDIPYLLSLPPSALKGFSSYAVQLRQAQTALIAVSTTFGLTTAKSGGGVEFKALTLKIDRKLPYAEMKRAASLRTEFEYQMKMRGIHVEEAAGGESEGNGHGITVLDQSGKAIA